MPNSPKYPPLNLDHDTSGLLGIQKVVANVVGNGVFRQADIYDNLLPSEPYRHDNSHIFMNAMQPGLEWVYHGNSAHREEELRLGVGPCLRSSGGLSKVGESKKHLLLFQMLGVTGKQEDIQSTILRVHTCIRQILGNTSDLHCRISPDDIGSQDALRELGIDFSLEAECVFDGGKKSDRSGSRIEFVHGGEDGMEVFNLVLATHVGQQTIPIPIIDGGGALERLLMIRESVDDGVQTSLYPFDNYKSFFHTYKLPDATRRKIIHLVRAIVFLKKNNINVENHSNNGKIEKTLSRLYRLLYMAFLEGDFDPDISAIQKVVQIDQDFLFINSLDVSDLIARLESYKEQKDKIYAAMKAVDGKIDDKKMQRIANTYCGGCLEMLKILQRYL